MQANDETTSTDLVRMLSEELKLGSSETTVKRAKEKIRMALNRN
jgi:hypothetical protein